MIFLAIAWYLIGLLVFLTKGQFNLHSPEWDKGYYLWDKLKDVIFIAAIIKPIPFSIRWAVKPIFVYAIIRFIWEIISTFTGLTVNNPKVMGILFILATLACLYLMVNDARKCLKQRP